MPALWFPDDALINSDEIKFIGNLKSLNPGRQTCKRLTLFQRMQRISPILPLVAGKPRVPEMSCRPYGLHPELSMMEIGE